MFTAEVLKVLKHAGVEATEEELEIPSEPKYGELAFPCFKLAKQQGKNPNKLAKELVEKIKIPERSFLTSAEVLGGYVNFFFDWEKLSEKVLREALGKNYGRAAKIKKEKIMVRYECNEYRS